MLVDFLKGNHFEVDTTTMPWLWEARGPVCCDKESLGEMTKNVPCVYIYFCQWLSLASQQMGQGCSGLDLQQLGQVGSGPGVGRARGGSRGSGAMFSGCSGADRVGLRTTLRRRRRRRCGGVDMSWGHWYRLVLPSAGARECCRRSRHNDPLKKERIEAALRRITHEQRPSVHASMDDIETS
jgi:hypothetical protein